MSPKRRNRSRLPLHPTLPIFLELGERQRATLLTMTTTPPHISTHRSMQLMVPAWDRTLRRVATASPVTARASLSITARSIRPVAAITFGTRRGLRHPVRTFSGHSSTCYRCLEAKAFAGASKTRPISIGWRAPFLERATGGSTRRSAEPRRRSVPLRSHRAGLPPV